MAQKIGISYEETSAKTYEGTEKAFNTLIEKILKRKKKDMNGGISNNIKLTQPTAQKKKQKKNDCCS